MNKNDFRYMLRGKHVRDLNNSDFSLLKPVNKYGKKTDHAVILLHGFSSSAAVYRDLIPQLQHYDAIICPNLPGHASSIEDFSRTTATDWLLYATQICEDLFKKYHKVDIIGLSLGGLLTCKLSEHFSFNHIFLLAPALKLVMDERKNLAFAKTAIRLGFKEVRGTAGNLVTNEHAEISYRRIPLISITEMLSFILEHRWVAPQTPVDLFLGTQDKVVSSPDVEHMFLNLPNVTIHWLPNSAHILALEEDLEQIVTCINNTK
ncbi:MAG: alpha/beta fold hydrolase [Legionella sp.]|uniref:alpha/beta hydrolase n=1 Tax=Legionella sp. TaxID=459 RepID=UPI0039E5F410